MNPFKTALATLLLLLTVSACGGESESDASSGSVSMEGTYLSEKNNGSQMIAIVKNGVIKITLDDESSSSLYWQGTFADSAEQSGSKIVSKADTAALKRSILGSQDKRKVFLYEDDVLEFEMSMMGTTRDVTLGREG